MIDVDLALIKRAAETLLKSIAHARPVEWMEKLQPRDGDYDRVFTDDVVARAREGWAHFWANPPRSLAKPGQTDALVFAAPSEKFLGDNEFSHEFPGGYRKIANKLKPGNVWVRFKYVVPGETTGMAYDGLVYLDDHWAWFPKPWRVLIDEDSLVDD